ncbi:MAG TPA: Flp pilus assembly protein CpaB [Rhodopila sp.]
MLLRPLIAIILLVASAGLGWIAYKAVSTAPSSAQQAVALPPMKILVAAQPLQAGTLLKDTDLREQEFPAAAVPEGSFAVTDDARAEIRGAMLRRYLNAGTAVLQTDVLRPRDRGFLAAVLAPGTRAVSIGVDAKSGASGLISPGDLVDVILTQEFQRGDTPAGHRVSAETVLSLIRVIAVDQQIAQGAPAAIPAPTPAHVASTVTLQVSPEQANRLAVAERLGRLLLTVRPIEGEADTGKPAASALTASLPVMIAERNLPAGLIQPSEPPRPSGATVFGSDVSAALSRDEPAASPRMRVIEGDKVSEVTFHE